MENYKVYKHVFPNNKVYIGITQQTLKRRWQNGRGYYKNTFISKAINKYGWENIKHEVLFDNLSKEEAEQKEIELIAFYKSNQQEYGYNLDNGGSARGKHSEATIKKMRESKLGSKNAMYGKHLSPENKAKFLSYANDNTGKHLSEETKQKLRDKLKGRIISEETKRKMSESRKGKKLSLEIRKKLSEARKGIKFSEEHLKNLREQNRKKCKKVLCVETGCIFESIVDACKSLNAKHPTNIARAIKYNATAYGYHWEFYKDQIPDNFKI